ncbi:MAG: MBL fold metallo-hydrolase [Lachnospiraceae bacterium]|nr:MBL fold metallo-hydrolase [Lachnospiraceae bacterium]
MKVHQVKIDFNVTDQIKRYVYVYLIEGKYCYLIDSGVAGCQHIIIERIHEIGKELSDLRGIFLTHAHPDHIGTAAWFKEQTGCKIYASKGEMPWIEDIDLQFKERPIPNFYKLAGKSVAIDQQVKDGDELALDEAFSFKVIGTKGHSIDEVSYKAEDSLFIGDSVPVKGDIPIYVDCNESIRSLNRIKSEKSCKWFYPAWDYTYDSSTVLDKIEDANHLIHLIDLTVKKSQKKMDDKSVIVNSVCEILHNLRLADNPLFARTIESHMDLRRFSCL